MNRLTSENVRTYTSIGHRPGSAATCICQTLLHAYFTFHSTEMKHASRTHSRYVPNDLAILHSLSPSIAP